MLTCMFMLVMRTGDAHLYVNVNLKDKWCSLA